jgi:hypothetical protein
MKEPNRPGIPAIPTKVNGIWYRSRLEARVAMLFHTIGIQADYEPDGFILNGVGYLPDFYLPQVRMFLEVKPREFSEIEMQLAKALAIVSKRPVILFVGRPELRCYPTIHPVFLDDGVETEIHSYLLDIDYHKRRYYEDEKRFWCCCQGEFGEETGFSSKYRQAVIWVRTCSFEEGY